MTYPGNFSQVIRKGEQVTTKELTVGIGAEHEVLLDKLAGIKKERRHSEMLGALFFLAAVLASYADNLILTMAAYGLVGLETVSAFALLYAGRKVEQRLDEINEVLNG